MTHRIPWYKALLIYINVTVGAGVFINLMPVYTAGGVGGGVAYLIAACLMAPVVLTIASLTREHPAHGGLFVFSKHYSSPFIGFVSGWSYFVGKCVSISLLSQVFMRGMVAAFPTLGGVHPVLLGASCVATLILLGGIGIRIGGNLQYLFIAAKAIPMLAVGAFIVLNPGVTAVPFTISWDGIFDLMPVAVFAMVGFEAMPAIAHLIAEPRRVIVPVMVGGFVSVISILFVLQTGTGMLLAHSGINAQPPLQALALFYAPMLGDWAAFFAAAMYVSVLGGAFGMLMSNCWNLYTVADEGFLPGRSLLTFKSWGDTPLIALSIEGIVAVLIMSISRDQAPLQNCAIIGMVTAFFTAVIAALRAQYVHGVRIIHPAVMWAALGATAYLLYLTAHKIYLYGISLPVFGLYLGGMACAALWRGFCSSVFSQKGE